ncbi:cysE, serine O-acetyltransferase [Nostoc flagelliforme CCNUN1]|uniref:CysE, serine O-acetyltransferase n=1 Tax=Nostoc flagelliforme CCNUN1 TaxID=2038116 RepID=A0A2K8SZG2_9NOSO|nr:serine acetyltransferase [Nostoc flagelliforme]AUB40834.1 cysE, serine O-acetyltransferase [Nostoc flagelliforme CCNUN1]
MRDFAIKLIKTIQQIMTVPMLILFIASKNQEVIIVDVRRWAKKVELIDSSDWANLLYLLYKYPEFRSLYYYRIKQGNFISLLLMHIIKFFYKECPSLFLDCNNIGNGLFLKHAFSTIISAESIGENCSVSQQVTVGYNTEGRPIIGNNVSIGAGAKVIGKVTIDDNVKVGANAVVVKNVPKNCVVVGVPAYIVKRDGVKVKEQLI